MRVGNGFKSPGETGPQVRSKLFHKHSVDACEPHFLRRSFRGPMGRTRGGLKRDPIEPMRWLGGWRLAAGSCELTSLQLAVGRPVGNQLHKSAAARRNNRRARWQRPWRGKGISQFPTQTQRKSVIRHCSCCSSDIDVVSWPVISSSSFSRTYPLTTKGNVFTYTRMQTCSQHRFTFHSQHCFCLVAEEATQVSSVHNVTATVSLETLRRNGAVLLPSTP